MDVPFLSSGASSRTHYALVRKVESAQTEQAADQLLLAAVASIKQRISSPSFSVKQCKEALLVLLYCYVTASAGVLPQDVFHFALPHALNLAECGSTISMKRIGYLFCAELMPPRHELQLMLINTLRKDVESDSVARMCLALDNLVANSNEDVIPAVQDRLRDLLFHQSFHVRRRVLLAFRALSRHDPDILPRILTHVETSLEDSNDAVVNAGLIVITNFISTPSGQGQPLQSVQRKCFRLLGRESGKPSSIMLRLLHTISGFEYPNDIPKLLAHAIELPGPWQRAYLYEVFVLLQSVPMQVLRRDYALHPVPQLRPLLNAKDPNDLYLFLACLERVDPTLWAGLSDDMPPLFEGWEVEKIMHMLHSTDALIRRKTLAILGKIDAAIISGYYSQTLQSAPQEMSPQDKKLLASRLLEIVESQTQEDGETYTRELKDILWRLEHIPPSGHVILENVVEAVLEYIRCSKDALQVACVTTILAFVAEPLELLSQTFLVISSAIAVEFCGTVSISPMAILEGFCSRLHTCIIPVQDACLIAMLRVSVDCESVPEHVSASVDKLGQSSGRHIKKRCEEFCMLASNKVALLGVLRRAKSTTLPDFVTALTAIAIEESTPSGVPVVSPPSERSGSSSKLRYDAYAKPSPIQKLHLQRSSSSPRTPSPRRISLERTSHSSFDTQADLRGSITAGTLALMTGSPQLLPLPMRETTSPLSSAMELDDLSHRIDLIAFDGVNDTSEAHTTSTFEQFWNDLESTPTGRGWCEGSVDNVLAALQKLPDVYVKDVSFVAGEHTVMVCLKDQAEVCVALRFETPQEGGCSWRLRSGDPALRKRMKHVLADVEV